MGRVPEAPNRLNCYLQFRLPPPSHPRPLPLRAAGGRTEASPPGPPSGQGPGAMTVWQWIEP
eukprot:7150961-Alexandrium_andersonii.AAC.1